MPPKKHRRPPRPQQLQEQSDYDSEVVHTDNPHGHNTHDQAAHTVPVRTNEELNLTVLKRHNPQIQQVLSVANFAVVYTFSAASQSWEKTGMEGTLFICQLIPAVIYNGDESLVVERYSVMVLNRKGLDNFSSELHTSSAVEVSDDFVMLEVPQEDGEEPLTYGFWIFSEPGSSTENTRVVNAQIMMECATRSEQSREAAKNALEKAEMEEKQAVARYEAPAPAPAQQESYGQQQYQQQYQQQHHDQQQAYDQNRAAEAQHAQRSNLLSLFNSPPPQAQAPQQPQQAQQVNLLSLFGSQAGQGQQQHQNGGYPSQNGGYANSQSFGNGQYQGAPQSQQQSGQQAWGQHQSHNGYAQQQYQQQQPPQAQQYNGPQHGYLPHAHPQQTQYQAQQPPPSQPQNLLSLFR